MSRNLAGLAALLILLAASVLALSGEAKRSSARPGSAAVFMVDNLTTEDLVAKYESAPESDERVKIFIMPGHEPEYGGAEYRDLKERDMVLSIAERLKAFLERDGHYEVVLGRDEDGWNPALEDYFVAHRDEIQMWRRTQARIMGRLVEDGEIKLAEEGVIHQKAPDDVALRLYGINKWVGEQGFDLAIHLHINDYGGRKAQRPGKYSGYAIYVPERQYSNSAAAQMVARSVSARLSNFVAQSDLLKESGGVVEDQELVAVGRYNTADAPSILVEYGYIYEPQFGDPALSEYVFEEYAYQTYLGLRDFFSSGSPDDREARVLPYVWKRDMKEGDRSLDVFALQLFLRREGLYPPKGETLNGCPASGAFGRCTKLALSAFQKREGVAGEAGLAGEKTRAALRKIESQR